MKYQASYVYDLAVFDALYRAVYGRKAFYFWWPLIVFLVLAIANAVPAHFQPTPVTVEQIAFDIVGFPLLLSVVFYFFWRFWLPRVSFKSCPTAGKKLDFTIDGDGLSCFRDDGVKESWPWTALCGITHLEDGSASIVWIAQNGGFVLPKAAFSSPDAYQAARKFIEEKFGGTGYKK